MITLTHDGEEIARRAEQILANIQDIADYAKTRAGLLSGVFRLGIIPTIAPYILPKLLPVLNERYPDLELKLRESTTSRLTEEILQGQLDAILLALPVNNGDLQSQTLFEDPFFLVTNSQDPIPNDNPKELLDKGNLLLLEEGHCLRDQAISLCEKVSPENLSQFGATSLKTLLELVAGNQGITLIPKLAAHVEIPKGSNLRLIKFPHPAPSRTIGLVWRKTSPRHKDFTTLCEEISKVANN